MDQTTMFNVLSILAAVGVGTCLIYVRRLRRFVASPSWTLKLWAFLLFMENQIGGLLNIYLYGGGLNRLGMFNTVCRAVGIGLLAASYITLDKTLDKVFKKFRLKKPVKTD